LKRNEGKPAVKDAGHSRLVHPVTVTEAWQSAAVADLNPADVPLYRIREEVSSFLRVSFHEIVSISE
jgi:hypothetical protein